MVEEYDAVIVGGGVTGTATLYVLSRYTPLKRIVLIEKYTDLAQVNSHKDNNAQTLHVGDIETNYSVEKARKVKDAAMRVARYVESHKDERLHIKRHKMVLGVGKSQARTLEKRHKEVKELFPDLEIIGPDRIGKLEPEVLRGRDPGEDLRALFSEEGYIVNYGELSRSFVRNAKRGGVDILLGTQVNSIKERKGGGYDVILPDRTLGAKTVVVAAGSHSLSFAYGLGYGKDWILLPVAGSFYYSKRKVNGKIYRLQEGSIPFSAPHADLDVQEDETRYGPLAKVLPMLERYRYGSVWDFFRLFEFRWDALVAITAVLSDFAYVKYLARQVLYDIPFLGKWKYLQEIREIIPTLSYREFRQDKNIGGIRPQILDVRKRKLVMGEAKIKGQNIIFDITPSPGASVCLKAGEDNAREVLSFLGITDGFDEKRFRKELC